MSVSVFVSNNPTPFHYQTKVIGVLDGYIYEAPVVIYGYDETSPTSMPLSILRRTFAKDSVPEKIFSIENFKCQIFCRYGNIANNFGCRFTANYTMDGKGKCIYALCRGVFQDENSNTSNTDSFFQVADAPWHLFRFHIDSGKIDIFLIKLNQFNEGFFMPCHCIGSGDLFQYLGNNTLVLYNDFLDAFPIGSKTKLNLFQHLLTLSEDESIAKLEKFGKEYVDESDENTIVIENQPDLKFTSAPIVPIASDKWIILDDNGQMVLGNTTGGSKWKILKPTKETNEQFYKRDGLDNENYRKFYRSGNNIYFLCLKNVDGEPDEVMLYEIKVFEEKGTFEAKFLGTTKAEALNATPSFIYDIFIHNGVLFYLNEGILLTAFFRPLKQEEKEVLNKH